MPRKTARSNQAQDVLTALAKRVQTAGLHLPTPRKRKPAAGQQSNEKVVLTEKRVQQLEAPDADRQYHYDGKTPGFAVCVTRSGAKSFYVIRKFNGKPERYRLGGYPELSVEHARNAATLANADYANGKSPQAEKRVARVMVTLDELFAHYLEQHAKPHKKSWQYDQQQYNRYLLPWKSRKLSEIRKADVEALHLRIGEQSGHYAANRLRSLLHTLFSVAAGLGFDKPNPAHGVKRFKEKSRERFLQADELPRFFKALDKEPNATIRDCILLSLLTGARRSNMLAMRWDEVNLERGQWTIPDSKSKSGDAMLVQLSPDSVNVLAKRKAANEAADVPSEWVFPGHIKGTHLSTTQKNWEAICERANLPDLRLHDLRRTLGSWQAATGASLPIIGKSLGHKHQSTTAIYARLNHDPVRAAVNTANAAIMAFMPGADDDAQRGKDTSNGKA